MLVYVMNSCGTQAKNEVPLSLQHGLSQRARQNKQLTICYYIFVCATQIYTFPFKKRKGWRYPTWWRMSSSELDRAGRWGVFSLGVNRNGGRELDLSLYAFNYTWLAGLQSPESRGEAPVKTEEKDGGESEERGSQPPLRVNSTDTFTRPTGGCWSSPSILSDILKTTVKSKHRCLAFCEMRNFMTNIVFWLSDLNVFVFLSAASCQLDTVLLGNERRQLWLIAMID